MFVIELVYKVDLKKIDAHMTAHVKFLKKYYSAGNFLVSGRKIPRDGGIILAVGKDRQEIEKIRVDLVATQRELRHVKRELRKDIDRLDGVLKFFNIAAVPLLIGLVSVGWAYRRRRPAAPTQAAEQQQ